VYRKPAAARSGRHRSLGSNFHSRPYEIFCRFVLLLSSSSSSATFFFLLPPGLAPFVGWLDSRVGKDDVGVGACDGVAVAEPGIDDSWRARCQQLAVTLCARGIVSLSLRYCTRACSTYPQKAGRAPAEYPVRIANGSLSPCRSTCSTGCCRSRGALDVVVKALDDVSGARLFKVLRFDPQDVVFKL